jgi:hypothetical protein
MTREQAVEAMLRIFGEERRRPTTTYRKTTANPLLQLLVPVELHENRKQRPRIVKENPSEYEVAGRNYELLMRMYSQLDPETKLDLIHVTLQLVSRGGASCRKSTEHYPSYYDEVSDLPLIAEFCVRTGHVEELLRSVAEVAVPTSAIVLLLMQIEEIVALNFDVLRPNEIKKVISWLEPLRKTAVNYSVKSSRKVGYGEKTTVNPHYRPGREREGSEIRTILSGISEECQQALYYCTKGAVERQGPLDAEGDKRKIVDYIESLQFPETMRGALEEAEKLFRQDASVFQLKSCMGHLRSFLEALHIESAKAIASSAAEQVDDSWGRSTEYLKTKGVISKQHVAFATSLYTLISDTSIHPLTTEYEYARLLRIVVIEYGVMFLVAVREHLSHVISYPIP